MKTEPTLKHLLLIAFTLHDNPNVDDFKILKMLLFIACCVAFNAGYTPLQVLRLFDQLWAVILEDQGFTAKPPEQ